MPSKTDGPSRPKVQLVCTGKARSGNEICWVFRVVLSGDSVGDERVYGQKNLRSIRVGHVYELDVDATEPTRIYADSARWLRVWGNEAEAAVWQTTAAAFDTEELARKHEKEQTSRRLPVELLSPIRREYWRTNSAGKLAIEVRVLAYLRMTSLNYEES